MDASQSRQANNGAMSEAGAAAAAAGAEPTPADEWETALSVWLKSKGDAENIEKAQQALHVALNNTRAYRMLFEAQTGIPFAISERASEGTGAGSSGKDEVDSSAASAAAGAGAGAAEGEITEIPVWLDFTPTPIRADITSSVAKTIRKLRTEKNSVSFFKESEHWLDMLTEQLVALVLNGREDDAKALIEACPYLLERRATVTDPVGRVYENVTAYEAALYAGDTQMSEMMHPFFEKHRGDGEAIRFEQCRNVFPNGVKAVIEAQKPYNFSDLMAAIDEASIEDIKDQLEHKVTHTKFGKAINQFRNDFVTLSKQEQHANLKHLLKAFELYASDKCISNWWGTGNHDKLDVFWCQVIGFVELFLPECDKQVFHQGLYNVVDGKERFERKVDLKVDRRGYSLHLGEASSGCGFDFAGGRRAARICTMPMVSPSLWLDWEIYTKQKHEAWNTYAAADKPWKPCVIQ